VTADTNEAVTALERAWPGWQVWVVPTWDGHQRGLTWCARRKDGQGHVLNAYSARELKEYLAEASG
jgi:hypothetical protein